MFLLVSKNQNLQAAMMNRELIAYKLVKIMLKLQSNILMHRAVIFDEPKTIGLMCLLLGSLDLNQSNYRLVVHLTTCS